MNEIVAKQSFQLKPFIGDNQPAGSPGKPEIAISGWAERSTGQNLLRIHYRLEGDLQKILIPDRVQKASRCDNLWQNTCFEWFGAVAGQAPYWECNLSPSGDWNLYRLADYRQALEVDQSAENLGFAVARQENILSLDLSCPLPPALGHAQTLELGICAVIKSRRSAKIPQNSIIDLSYWALAHPGEEADFHNRQGWTLSL
ncbi:DOMON-like domain-containing protein [Cyanobium sp. HWJ4-Hawea]|uniref:DOMON-like domain-containing protein n=1 Tax=Cyanobium sp. HWJ4-Hawea TaxID=2823713 RepID=UPI0020CB8383|nr:DOMON-like domain-containing protein [Cyanobium sp. HWJ4-Hawea]